MLASLHFNNSGGQFEKLIAWSAVISFTLYDFLLLKYEYGLCVCYVINN